MFITRIATEKRLVLALAIALIISLGAHVVRTDGAAIEASEGRVTAGSADVLSARIGTVMGRSTLDLRETTITPGEDAVVTVFVAMGRVILRVPPDWDVDTAALPAISRVSDTRGPRTADAGDSAAPRPRLVVRGVVMFGTVEVAS